MKPYLFYLSFFLLGLFSTNSICQETSEKKSACLKIEAANKKPAAPEQINGPIKLCPAQTATYSISEVPKSSGYIWKVEGGVSIISGQGTSLISIKTKPDFKKGAIKVQAVNCFDHSETITLKITKVENCEEILSSKNFNFKNTTQNFFVDPNPISGILLKK